MIVVAGVPTGVCGQDTQRNSERSFGQVKLPVNLGLVVLEGDGSS
jgi:hypothetical protein